MIEGLDNINNLKGHDKVKLMINGILTELGFKSVNYKKVAYENGFFDNIYEKKLSLYINPELNQGGYNLEPFDIKKIKGYCRNDYQPYYNYTSKDKDIIDIEMPEYTIKCSHYNKIYVGRYYKTQNILVFLYPIFSNCDMSLEENNEILFYLLNILREICKKYNVKKCKMSFKYEDVLFKNFSKNIASSIELKEGEIITKERDIKEYDKRIYDYHKFIQKCNLDIEGYQRFLITGKKKLKKEITEIKKLKFVKDVILDFNKIIVNIGDVNIQFKDLDVYIGEFIITISPSGIDIDVKERKKVWDGSYFKEIIHPHINNTNTSNICWGDRKAKVYELLANLDLKDLVFWIKLWAKSYNPEDKYVAIGYWTGELGKKPEPSSVSSLSLP